MITREMLPWREGPMMRLGHCAMAVLPFIIASFIIRDLLGWPGGGVSFVFDVLTSAWAWTIWCEITVHSRHLCERCAAETPLDPQRSIDRWRPALFGFHRGVLQGALVAVLAWAAVTTVVFHGPHWPYWACVADACLQAAIAVTLFGSYKHSRLQPWCPYCHWDDGGDAEVSPDVPAPAVSR